MGLVLCVLLRISPECDVHQASDAQSHHTSFLALLFLPRVRFIPPLFLVSSTDCSRVWKSLPKKSLKRGKHNYGHIHDPHFYGKEAQNAKGN